MHTLSHYVHFAEGLGPRKLCILFALRLWNLNIKKIYPTDQAFLFVSF